MEKVLEIIVDENYNIIADHSTVDQTLGTLEDCVIINPDAKPIDNINKFAWEDSDYINCKRYVLNKEVIHTPTPEEDLESITVDHEYRLTVLELGLNNV